MEIKGNITTGYGKGAYFLSQNFYKDKFNDKCGFTPFPGTLNILIDDSYLDDVSKIKNSCDNVIKSGEGFGGLKYIKATLEDKITGAIVFPDKTTHNENYLEFIAKDNLRNKLKLKDNDEIKIKININI